MSRISQVIGAFAALMIATNAQGQNSADTDFLRLMAKYDLDGDGVISPPELALLNREIQVRRAREARRNNALPPAVSAPPVMPPKPGEMKVEGVLLLRDQFSVVPFITRKGAEGTLSENGATLSWTNDRVAGKTTLQGSGALFYALHGELVGAVPGTVDTRTPLLTHFALLPGVEWDFVSRNGKSEGVVTGRAGAELEILGGLFPLQYVRGSVTYTTDVATSSAEVFGTDWSFIPVNSRFWVGTSRPLAPGLGLWLGIFPSFSVEYAHVGRNGMFGDLMSNHDYLWAGPKVLVELSARTGLLSGASVYAKYFYLYELMNGANANVNYLETGVKYSLLQWGENIDPASRSALSTVFKYTVGTAPRTLQRKDELFAGLELKLGDIPSQ